MPFDCQGAEPAKVCVVDWWLVSCCGWSFDSCDCLRQRMVFDKFAEGSRMYQTLDGACYVCVRSFHWIKYLWHWLACSPLFLYVHIDVDTWSVLMCAYYSWVKWTHGFVPWNSCLLKDDDSGCMLCRNHESKYFWKYTCGMWLWTRVRESTPGIVQLLC